MLAAMPPRDTSPIKYSYMLCFLTLGGRYDIPAENISANLYLRLCSSLCLLKQLLTFQKEQIGPWVDVKACHKSKG
ncbi:Uncharacterized protein TCM_006774 [Theobroma cacao]|uniref:Uncharacterized protein n=1 Tax=Theobroma cacao TaxID=3641 RepID=A0A061DYR5_THECC|nr:Uncharacterized protein TCM_006774 [Theobroma cacao]